MQLSPGLLLCDSKALGEKGTMLFFFFLILNFVEHSGKRQLRKREEIELDLQRDLG